MSNGSINKGSLVKGVKKVADKPIKQVSLLSVTTAPSGTFQAGSKYYNSTDKLIYTSVTDNSWTDAITEKPEFGTVYIYDNSGTIQYYQWNGVNLVQTDVNNIVFITGTQTITGNKTFSGSVALGDNASAQTKPTSDTSNAPATTQFVKDYAEDGEWQKPSDWVDIRSGALDNSIYFLVAHSIPTESEGVYSVADFNKFSISVSVSTGNNTYDVFVDGVKVATTNSGEITTLDWANLYTQGIIKSGYNVSYPNTYTTHIVRVSPSVETDTLETIKHEVISGQRYIGTLWAHFELNYIIDVVQCFGREASANLQLALLEAITASNDVLQPKESNVAISGLYRFATNCIALKKMPTFKLQGNYDAHVGLSFKGAKVRKIIIKNNSGKEVLSFMNNTEQLEIVDIENAIQLGSPTNASYSVYHTFKLKELPKLKAKSNYETISIVRADSLKPTFIDDSGNIARTAFRFYGASGHQTNLIGLVVSPEAPFNYTTAPQIDISYTNMSRAALIRLFNSMPTVSDSQEIDITGAIGAGDLTAEDLAIATGKGWTVTR